jgi:hypothetical protein
MSNQNANFDAASILDSNIEDLKELPGFEVPTPGIYNLLATAALKEINNATCVEMSVVVISCEEQDDPTATPTVPGTKSSMLFDLSRDFAVSDMKKIMKPFSEHFGVTNLRELVEETITDVQIIAKVGRRAGKVKNPGDPVKFFMQLSNITIL